MAIGLVLAWMSGEGLHPPSLPLFESRRPKGHQQAQRSDIAAVMIQRVYYVCSARESCSAAPAMRSQPCVRRPKRGARAWLLRLAPTGSNNELLLAQFVCASSRCFAPQEFGTNVSPGSADAVKSLRTRLFGRSQFGHNDRE